MGIWIIVGIIVVIWIWGYIATDPKFKIRLSRTDALQFSDGFITITFGFEENYDSLRSLTQIPFRLQNKTPSPIAIEWDVSTFVDPSGESCRMIHAGVKLIDRNSAQPSSIIAGRSHLSDILIPGDNIEWREGTGDTSGDWKYTPLLIGWKDKDVINFKVLLGIKINNQVKPYEFEFCAVNVKKKISARPNTNLASIEDEKEKNGECTVTKVNRQEVTPPISECSILHIQCPICGRKGKASENVAGKKIRCPSCKKVFVAERIEEDIPAFTPDTKIVSKIQASSDSNLETIAKKQSLCIVGGGTMIFAGFFFFALSTVTIWVGLSEQQPNVNAIFFGCASFLIGLSLVIIGIKRWNKPAEAVAVSPNESDGNGTSPVYQKSPR